MSDRNHEGMWALKQAAQETLKWFSVIGLAAWLCRVGKRMTDSLDKSVNWLIDRVVEKVK